MQPFFVSFFSLDIYRRQVLSFLESIGAVIEAQKDQRRNSGQFRKPADSKWR